MGKVTDMKEIERIANTAAPEPPLRGDPITGARYTSAEFFQKEWQNMWTKVWLLAAREDDIPEAGDYIVEEWGPESIIMVRQEDGGIRAFFNVCQHRGAKLTFNASGVVDAFKCPYHGWRWEIDGELTQAQDAEDFPDGNPCGKLRLKEVACDTFAGFIWINMDPDCVSLKEYLGDVWDQWQQYDLENMTRVVAMRANIPCNWKVIQDNFNESYHLPTVHPGSNMTIEEHYSDTQFDMFETGHARMIMKAGSPSITLKDKNQIQPPLAAMMQEWDLNPEDFRGREKDIRKALQEKKRELGPKRGYKHYQYLSDDQLTDFHHFTIFPNFAVSITADGFHYLRSRPHATDPGKCVFDHWFYCTNPEGAGDEVATPAGVVPRKKAEIETFNYGERSLGLVMDQDMSITTGQQLGFMSMAYEDAYISNQEHRIRRYHEVINDYIEGRRPMKPAKQRAAAE